MGTWEYWNEQGVKRVVDEDKKFGKFGYDNVIDFLEKEGHLDRKTGKGRESINLYFSESKIVGSKIWEIYINTGYSDIHEYKLDGEIGKVLSHKISEGGIE